MDPFVFWLLLFKQKKLDNSLGFQESVVSVCFDDFFSFQGRPGQAPAAAPAVQPPVVPQAAPAANGAAQNGGADYSAQWAEYYRSIGKVKEAETIEAQMKQKVYL